MISFKFFNRDRKEKVRIRVESDSETVSKIMTEAEKESNKARIDRYNDSVISNIKAKLMIQYSINYDHMSMMGYSTENKILEAICNDIAEEMGMLEK